MDATAQGSCNHCSPLCFSSSQTFQVPSDAFVHNQQILLPFLPLSGTLRSILLTETGSPWGPSSASFSSECCSFSQSPMLGPGSKTHIFLVPPVSTLSSHSSTPWKTSRYPDAHNLLSHDCFWLSGQSLLGDVHFGIWLTEFLCPRSCHCTDFRAYRDCHPRQYSWPPSMSQS